MQVQQQFVLGRPDDTEGFEVTTVAYDGDAMTSRENEILCREWMAFAPGAFGRVLVHVPLLDEAQDRIRAHVVALAVSRDDTVAFHLARFGPEAFARCGDEPFRIWRQGLLREDWDETTGFTPIDPIAVGDGLVQGLRTIFPEQYAVLEALLRRVLGPEPFSLPNDADDPAIEDLFEHLTHVTPRRVRRRQTLCTYASGSSGTFDVVVTMRDGATLRRGLRDLVAAPATELAPAVEGYVDAVFSRLRAKDFEGAAALVDDFDPHAPPVDEEFVAEEQVDAVATMVDGIVERVHEPADVTDADRTYDAIEAVEHDVVEPEATAEPGFEPDEPDVGVPAWEGAVLDGDEETPRRGRKGLIVLVVFLVLVAGGYGAVHFGVIDVESMLDREVAPQFTLTVGPKDTIEAFVDRQIDVIETRRSADVPIFELRQELAAHRVPFESDARATWAAEKAAVDARLRAALAVEAANDSSIAVVLRDAARKTSDVIPRLRALHAAVAAGRPEMLATSIGTGRSSLADAMESWVAGLEAWALRFEALAAGDTEGALPEGDAPTPGLAAFATFYASLDSLNVLQIQNADREQVKAAKGRAYEDSQKTKAVWGTLPFMLRGLIEPIPELTVDDAAEPESRTSR